MSRLFGVLAMLLVLLLAMGFAAANVGHRVTLSLGIFTLYQVPVTLVAFSGLFIGMLVMFATGINSDLKVRRILRERLAEDSRREQTWIDRSQQDLFADGARDGPDGVEDLSAERLDLAEPALADPVPSGQVRVDPLLEEPVLEDPILEKRDPDGSTD